METLKMRASRFHATERSNIMSGRPPNLCLSTDQILINQSGSLYSEVCPYPNSCNLTPSECYDQYLNDLSNQTFEIDEYKGFPGNAPIIAHILALIDSQEKGTLRSFYPFLSITLPQLTELRVDCTTRSIIFGSSSLELKEFRKDLNEELVNARRLVHGLLPVEFIGFNVQYVFGDSEQSFLLEKDESLTTMETKHNRHPARISFGIRNKRWDLIIPWERLDDSTGYEGRYKIKFQKISDDWFKFFQSISAGVLDFNLTSELGYINLLFSQVFKTNVYKEIKLKKVDIAMALYLIGANIDHLSIPSLSYFLLGQPLKRPSDMRRGLGLNHLEDLPGFLDQYIQVMVNTQMSIGCALQISHLLLNFPTPSVACMLSFKLPTAFLSWHSLFFNLICSNYHVDIIDDEVRLIPCLPNLLLSESDIISTIPAWSAVSFGGCWLDSLAIRFANKIITPILSRTNAPYHLRWHTYLPVGSLFLEAIFRNDGINSYPMSSGGCDQDETKMTIGDFTLSRNSDYIAVLEQLKPVELTTSQALLLHAHLHPRSALHHLNCGFYYGVKDCRMIIPLLTAYLGRLFPNPYMKTKCTTYQEPTPKRARLY